MRRLRKRLKPEGARPKGSMAKPRKRGAVCGMRPGNSISRIGRSGAKTLIHPAFNLRGFPANAPNADFRRLRKGTPGHQGINRGPAHAGYLNNIAHAQNPVLAFLPERLCVLAPGKAASASGLSGLIWMVHAQSPFPSGTESKNAFIRTCGLEYIFPASYALAAISLMYAASLININRSRNNRSRNRTSLA